MPRMVLLPLNSCEVIEGPDSRCGQWRSWAIMTLRVLFFITLLLLADAQKWPVTGDCQPCDCSYKITSFRRMRTVNCSRRGITAIPANLPDDLMALDLSWNSLDVEQLRQHLCKFQSLQSVSLSFADLTTLSDILQECSSLLELNLTGNRLAQVDSKTFMGLKNLRRLLGLEVDTVVNRDIFKYLNNLKDLDIIFHGQTLPKGLFDDLVVKSLNLVVTQASSLPSGVFEFGKKTLKTLQLIGERVTEVHKDLVDELSVLKKLYLVMPNVQKLPERFFHCQQTKPGDGRPMVRLANLQEVEISGVHTLPAMLFNQLVTLETLQLREIGSFPEMGFLDGVIGLRSLLITGSKLLSIPAGWFKELYSLKTLTLSGLQLERLHENAFRGLISLSYLDLSQNNLVQVTDKMLMPLNKTLETLILRGNFLTEINKDCLGKLSLLRLLDLSENRLENVHSNSFVGMTYLSVLYLNNNRLTSLPKDLFRDLLQLESLFLSDNYLVEFPKAVLQLNKSLMSLDLASNEIREVPASKLCQFVYLDGINILDNYLNCTCSLMAFQQCPKISIEGQCKSPPQYLDFYISDIEVPDSCLEEIRSNKKLDDEHMKPSVSFTPYPVVAPQTKSYTSSKPQSSVVDSSSYQLPQINQSDIKTLSTVIPTVIEEPVKIQQNTVLNQMVSRSSVPEKDTAKSAGQLTQNATIIRKLFPENLTNQPRKENSGLSSTGQNAIQTGSSQKPSNSSSVTEKHVLQSGGTKEKQSIAMKQVVTQKSRVTNEQHGTDKETVKPHTEQVYANSLTNKTKTEQLKNAIPNIQRFDHTTNQNLNKKEALRTFQQTQPTKNLLNVQSKKQNPRGNQELNKDVTQSNQHNNTKDMKDIQKSYKEKPVQSNKNKSNKTTFANKQDAEAGQSVTEKIVRNSQQSTKVVVEHTWQSKLENKESTWQSMTETANSSQQSNTNTTSNWQSTRNKIGHAQQFNGVNVDIPLYTSNQNNKKPIGIQTSVNQVQNDKMFTTRATSFSEESNPKPGTTVKNLSNSNRQVMMDNNVGEIEQRKNVTEESDRLVNNHVRDIKQRKNVIDESDSLVTNNVRGTEQRNSVTKESDSHVTDRVRETTVDRILGDFSVQGFDIPSKTIKSQPQDKLGTSLLGLLSPESTKTPLQGQREWNNTTLPTKKETVYSSSKKTMRGENSSDTKKVDSLIIVQNISTSTSTEPASSEESVENNLNNAKTTTFFPSTDLRLTLNVPVDAVEPVNMSKQGPEGDEIANNKKGNKNSEKTTFNFIISSMAALSVFGFTVLAIFFVRRCQQKGSYIISIEDTEMNNLDSDTEEATIFSMDKPKPL